MKTRNNQFILMSLSLLLSICLMSVGSAQAQVDDSHFYSDSSYYQVTPMPFNSSYADWGAYYHNGNVYFTSNRPDPRSWSLERRIDNRTKASYYMLYQSNPDTTNQFGMVTQFAKELGRRYNVGPMYMTPDGQKMVVTYNKDKRSAAKNYESKHYDFRLELYTFTYDTLTKKWSKPEAFPYNSSKYNCTHGFMSADGQYLYFSSDMPGTLGGMDIYVSRREGNRWGVPQNLGAGVNTANNEIFPSLSEDGYFLYFSSDKPGGMGGLDIYRTTLPINSESEVANLGYPVNSPFDDFGLTYYNKNEDGYFASNRPVALDSVTIDASDNIYHVHSTLPVSLAKSTKRKSVAVDVINDNTLTAADIVKAMANQNTSPEFQQALNAAIQKQNATGGDFVTLLEEAWEKVAPGKALADEFSDELQNVRGTTGSLSNSDMLALIRKESETAATNHVSRSKLVGLVVNTIGVPVPGVAVKVTDSKGEEQTYYTNLAGQFESAPFAGGRTLTATASYKMLVSETEVIEIPSSAKELRPEYAIYMELILPARFTVGAEVLFDYAQYTITERATDTLNMVVRAMMAQPSLTVVLEGHTDSRGSAIYNEVLSIRRARAVRNYLIEQGVAANRIKTAGYSFTRLLNDCIKGIECTDAEHQANRRVEFIFSKPLQK